MSTKVLKCPYCGARDEYDDHPKRGTEVFCEGCEQRFSFSEEYEVLPHGLVRASLVANHDRGGFRALLEMEGSGSRFYPSHPNRKERVVVMACPEADLYDALRALDIHVTRGVNKVAEKFCHEICALKGGTICWDEDTRKGFFKIVKYITK